MLSFNRSDTYNEAKKMMATACKRMKLALSRLYYPQEKRAQRTTEREREEKKEE